MSNKKTNTLTGFEAAVIGMAGRFPGANNIHEFWDNSKYGIESISFFSDNELEETGINTKTLENANYVKAKGIIADAEYFDAAFFNYSPGEAEAMDPQVRIFMECIWHTLEDAGYDPDTYNGLISLYAGATDNISWQGAVRFAGFSGVSESLTSNNLANKDFISTDISYKLNLKGPSSTVFNACSTSLVALHLAYQGLLSGECDIALAGGVSITLPIKVGYVYQEGMVYSADGHIWAFDERANGTLFGNGAAAVALKRFKDAIDNGDNIYAVIKGSGINNDGNRKVGFVAPSVKGQAEVIRAALQMAEVEPESIGYIEAHGTGTSIGDPIEIEALKQAFNTDIKNFCCIGTVKTNVGHLDAAGGVTGLIKAVLVLKHKIIPPSLNFENQNQKIDLKNSPFYVNTELKEWRSDQYPLRAGVSSFGIGGTNIHVILEEAPIAQSAERQAQSTGREYQLILLSAKTLSSLEQMTQNLAKHFKKNPNIDLADAAYTLQVGRRPCEYRRALVCSSVNEAIQALENPGSEKVQTFLAKDEKKDVVFMFSGQGSQYVNMGLDIYKAEPSFRANVDRCLDILKSIFGYDVRHILFPQKEGKEAAEKKETQSRQDIDEVIYSGPIKFILDYSLARLLMKWGIQPHAMIGHSFGEYMAACLSGVFSLEDALQVVIWRGQLMKKTPKGVMMSVPLPEEELKPLLNEDLSLAAVNTASLCIVSGTVAAAEQLENQLSEQGYECVRLNFPHASHSRMMEPILEEFQEKISRLKRNRPRIPYISNVTGQWITDQQATNPAYWATHMRQAVRFESGIKELLKKTSPVFIQVGPGRGLTLFVEQHPGKSTGQLVINLLRHPKEDVSDIYFLLSKIGLLWLSGVNIDWSKFYCNEKRNRISLPTYHFDHKRYWKYADEFLTNRKSRGERYFRKKKDIADWFYIPSWKRSMLPGHIEWQHHDMPPSNWLVFMDELGLGHKLSQQLEKKGQNIIIVRIGRTFKKVNDMEYTINVEEVKNYELLFNELKQYGKFPTNMIHLWNITAIDCEILEAELTEKYQYLGYYSLLNIAKSIGKMNITDETRIMVVSNNVQEVFGEDKLCPGKAPLIGAVKGIPKEYANIHLHSIDVILPDPDTLQEEKLVRQLLEEFVSDSIEPIITFRDNHRWVEIYEPVRLENAGGRNKHSRLKEKGVYLITGGLGGIGLALAEYLAREVPGVKLILFKRTEFPPKNHWEQWLNDHNEDDSTSQKIKKIQHLEELGAEVFIGWAEISDLEKLRELIVRAQDRFGPVNGIIHSAGIPEGVMIQARTRENSKRVFNPKINGTLVLDTIFKDGELDFFILCSSMDSIIANIGRVGYCAANVFLNAYAKYNAYHSNTFTVSINWPRWQSVGMAVIPEKLHKELKGVELTGGLTIEEGVDAFSRILENRFPQVAISFYDLMTAIERDYAANTEAFMEEYETANVSRSENLYQRPQLANEYLAPMNEIEEKIAEIWQNFFGFEKVGINDDFFKLGGDSLKAMIVASMIHKKLNVKVSVTNIFTTPTIKELAEYINDNVKKTKYSSIEPAEKKEYHHLSSAQKRLYILQLMAKENTGYNETVVTQLQGELDKERLEYIFRKMIDRHDMLRTSFDMIEGEPVQRVHDHVEFKLEYYDLQVTGALTHSDRCRWEVEPFGQDLFNSGENLATEDTENTEGTRGLAPLPIKSAASPSEIIKHFIRPFDMSRAPLLKVMLINLERERNVVAVDMHHIIKDGTSQEIFLKEFMALYGGEELPPLPIQYKDYSEWQNSEKRKKEIKKQEEYWLKQFETEIPVINLPSDYSRPAVQSFEGNTLSFVLEKEKTSALKELTKEQDVTLYMLLLAILNILLSRLSRQEDIVVGTPIAGRNHPEVKGLMGMFVNTLAIRNYPKKKKTFKEFLKEIKKRTLEAFENQEYQFEDLVDKAEVNRDASRNPLFDVSFVFQNLYLPSGEIPEVRIPGLRLKPYGYKKGTSKFDMSLFALEAKEKLILAIDYCTKLFKEKTIERFVNYFKQIVSVISKDAQKKILDIEILTNKERQEILFDFNNTAAVYPKNKTIHGIFEEQVESTPDHTALIGPNPKFEIRNSKQIQMTEIQNSKQEGTRALAPLPGLMSITYKELNEKSNQLAHLLRRKGVGPDIIVGIMAERSTEVIIGILGILKGAAAYLPIDPEYPQERIAYMLADSNVKTLFTTRLLAEERENVESWEGETIFLEGLSVSSGLSAVKKNHLHLSPAPVTSLAYVIYTSGSTGKPKGVMVQHHAVVNLVFSQINVFDINTYDRILQFSSICFDASVEQIFTSLFSGSTLVLIDKDTLLQTDKFAEFTAKQSLTHLHAVPSFLNNINPKDNHPLKRILSGGDVCPVPLAKRLSRYCNYNFYNKYGPTETTVTSIEMKFENENETLDHMPIGRAINNTNIYLLDEEMKLVPPGTAGELYIGGDGVARGYLNRPELTEERFKRAVNSHLSLVIRSSSKNHDKFSKSTNEQFPMTNDRLYKSGDLARFLPDGNIEFLGRIDDQVKIRGFRIELGEIESLLLKHNEISGAVVLAKEDEPGTGNKFLSAYIVLDKDKNKTFVIPELKEYLSAQLPTYMIPSYFIQIDKIPLTSNGKIDKKALPKPTGARPHLKEAYAAPGTDMERIIADTWKEVLKLEKVGIHDRFFELGGNSLNIIQVNNKLREAFGKDLPIIAMFRYATIRSFSQFLSQQGMEDTIDRKKRSEALKQGKGDIKQMYQKKKQKNQGRKLIKEREKFKKISNPGEYK